MKINIKNQPIIFTNKSFQTIMIKVVFPFSRNDNEIAKLLLLPNLLHYVTANYPTEKELVEEFEKNYILNCFCSSNTSGTLSFINFNMVIPNEETLQEDYIEKQIKILSEIIYNPKIENKAFTKKEFDRELESLKVNIEKGLKDVNNYAITKAKELLDESGLISASIYNHQDQLETITSENLYDYYLDKVYNNDPLIYIFGDIDKEKITNICNKYIYRKKFKNKQIDYIIRDYFPITELKEKEENSSFHNSVYITFYKVKDMKREDETKLNLINDLLLSNSSRILSKRLRDDKELVYSTCPFSYTNYGVLGIASLINKDNIEEVKEETKKALDDLKNEKIIEENLNNIKEEQRINLLKMLDNKVALFSEKIICNLKTDISSKEYYDDICKITPKDIKDFAERIVHDTSYFLKEEEHD